MWCGAVLGYDSERKNHVHVRVYKYPFTSNAKFSCAMLGAIGNFLDEVILKKKKSHDKDQRESRWKSVSIDNRRVGRLFSWISGHVLHGVIQCIRANGVYKVYRNNHTRRHSAVNDFVRKSFHRDCHRTDEYSKAISVPVLRILLRICHRIH